MKETSFPNAIMRAERGSKNEETVRGIEDTHLKGSRMIAGVQVSN